MPGTISKERGKKDIKQAMGEVVPGGTGELQEG